MATYNTDLKIEDLQLSPDMKELPVIAKYDVAVRELLSQVFAGSVILAPSDRAFDLYIDQMKDKLRFPFISLFPSGGYTCINKNYPQSNIGNPIHRQAILYDNSTLEKIGRSSIMQNFYQVMYFDIPYSIECWSTNRIQALQLVQELAFWLKAQGQVLIKYKDSKFTANMTIQDNIQDSTSYTSYADLGNVYRFTLNINIEAPVFRTANYLNITKAEIELELRDGLEKED